MESSNEVSWQSAYYALIPIALNSMIQSREPTGKTCGFDASLRIYLRSSPIVCAVDAAFILIRFAFYMRRGCSLAQAAKEIRSLNDEEPRPEEPVHEEPFHEEPRPGKILSLEFNTYLLYAVVAIGTVAELLKLSFYSGGSGAIPWTQVWAWFYFGSWLVAEVTFWLALREDNTNFNRARIEALEGQIAPYERVFGGLAILVQLGILATVDMKPIPLDPNMLSRWLFRGVRFATHCAAFVVHLPFLKITSIIDAGQAVTLHHMGVLLISIGVPLIVSALMQDKRFSSLYFIVSIMISYFSWTMYCFSWTRKWLLFCEPKFGIEPRHRHGVQIRIESRHGGGPGKTRWQNVLAFDFFLRIGFFSAYWYVVHYDPTGTAKPQWTNNLG